MLALTKDGFNAVWSVDNGNIYAVMLSEMVSNIFKEGMWFKALGPYMLIITNDPIAVANMMTLNGATRAVVGVSSGRIMINNLGIDAVWIVSGIVGVLGLLVNVICLSEGSIAAAYFLNFTWAVYNGLWNSCLETSWARSMFQDKREDINGARQITNKITTSLGPLFSAAIFLYCGNHWDVSLVQNVMLFGTGMTSLVVALCFCFRSSQEIEQDLKLRDLGSMEFPSSSALSMENGSPKAKSLFLEPMTMCQSDFVSNKEGYVWLTCPLGGNSDAWASRIRILTANFEETRFILAKQFRASLARVDADSCILHFRDVSRPSVPVKIQWLQIYLTQVEEDSEEDPKVETSRSSIRFRLDPGVMRPRSFSAWRVVRVLLFGTGGSEKLADARKPQAADLKESLLDPNTGSEDLPEKGKTATDVLTQTPTASEKIRPPNLFGAKVIVVCDVLNALGAGFSLKFIDLFLKVDYGVSPAGVFGVAFLQNIMGALLTPVAKKLLVRLKSEGYRAKLGVVFLWALALLFLGTICIPGMPLFVVIPCIVLMQSLNSCTRAFNRAQLINFLPREEIANYMTWDALNKANQGGIAFVGGHVVVAFGYRGCFFVTFLILFVRMLIYLAFTLRKGTIYRGSFVRAQTSLALRSSSSSRQSLHLTETDLSCVENIRGNDADEESQMFQPAEALALASQQPSMPRNQGVALLEIATDRLADDWQERPSRKSSLAHA